MKVTQYHSSFDENDCSFGLLHQNETLRKKTYRADMLCSPWCGCAPVSKLVSASTGRGAGGRLEIAWGSLLLSTHR